MIRHASGPIGENDPAIVFAGFATDGSCTVKEMMKEALKCPKYLYRHSQTKTRHSADTRCFYCTPIEMDLRPQQERLNRVMASKQSLLLGLGSEFMKEEQEPFLRFFLDPQKYPQLKQLFDQSISGKSELELETNGVPSLAIYHTYAENGRSASSDEFALDSNPEEFLRRKGLIQ